MKEEPNEPERPIRTNTPAPEVYTPDQNEIFIKKKFSEFYERHKVSAPLNVASKEFGFGSWAKKIAVRHFSFSNERELQGYLARNAPLYISYSIGNYKYPTARPIEKKIMQTAELVFDIDSNELDVQCIKRHGKEFICDECMEAAKDAAAKLIEEFLIRDFSVSPSKISVNWSGNRGYHIHIEDEFDELGGYARREIADYVNGKGVGYDNVFREMGAKIIGPKPSEGSWRGRIARTVLGYIRDANFEELGVSPKTAKKFYDQNASKGIEEGNWERVYISNRKKFYSELIDRIVKIHSCNVDEQVTMDMSRLIRLPDSLHGETGMIAKRIAANELKKFNPFKDPLAFGKGQVTVHVNKCPSFILGDQTFGPFDNEKKELPEFAAIYLICKKAASII